jgi:hypothetical protein
MSTRGDIQFRSSALGMYPIKQKKLFSTNTSLSAWEIGLVTAASSFADRFAADTSSMPSEFRLQIVAQKCSATCNLLVAVAEGRRMSRND